MRQHLFAAKIRQELLYVKSFEFDWNGHGQKSAQRSGGRDRSRTPSGDGGHRLFGFGKHKGRAFEDVYRKERDYVKWVQRIPRPTSGLAEFKRFIRQPKSKAVERPEQERDCKGKQLAKADLLGFLKNNFDEYNGGYLCWPDKQRAYTSHAKSAPEKQGAYTSPANSAQSLLHAKTATENAA